VGYIQPMPKLGPWVEELERQQEANEKTQVQHRSGRRHRPRQDPSRHRHRPVLHPKGRTRPSAVERGLEVGDPGGGTGRVGSLLPRSTSTFT